MASTDHRNVAGCNRRARRAIAAALRRAAPVALALLLTPGVARAQDQASSPAGETPAESKLSFHAFVNQAYAKTDGHQIFGIPKDGTTDYRTVALQTRYSFDRSDSIVAQLIQNRLGVSTINKVRGDVELELAFYEHHFEDSTIVRVGKMQLPMGIYNEIRDVGTLLPFFAPPENIYLDNQTSRDVEGVMVSHSFEIPGKWSLDADLYGGGWNRIEQSPASGSVAVARAENGLGTQLWLNTPISGLRFGVAAFRFDAKGRLDQVNRRDLLRSVNLSCDGTFGRFYTRAEFLIGRAPVRFSPFFSVPNLTYKAYYGQAGVNLTDWLSLNLQADFSRYNLGLGTPDVVNNEDYALGLTSKLRSNLVLKLEGHKNRGREVENEPTALMHTNYGLLSFAVTY